MYLNATLICMFTFRHAPSFLMDVGKHSLCTTTNTVVDMLQILVYTPHLEVLYFWT